MEVLIKPTSQTFQIIMMDPVFLAAVFTLVIIYRVYRRYTHISLAYVPGPESPSSIMGNLKDIYQGQAAEADFKWQAQYGDVIRFKGVFGEDQLMISDPAALQYICVKSGYRFAKPEMRRVLNEIISGRGMILNEEGDNHKRQRRVMLPAFGKADSRAFVSLFKSCAESMSNKWMDVISESKEQSGVFDIPKWLSRATLDAIGEAGFDVRFGSIDNNETALGHAYSSLMADAFGSPSDAQVFLLGVSEYIPKRILKYLLSSSKSPRMMRLHDTRDIVTSVAKQMVQGKSEMLLQGNGGRDVFSLLVKANMDADAKAKLTEEELYSQMSAILFAGHETTSMTITWALFELARNPEIQTRLRAEIRKTEATVHARGDTEFTSADFDTMSYTTAVIQEVLRLYCVAYHTFRYATQDEILPLSQPITKRSGEIIHKLPVPKGTQILISIAAYNRKKDLWGDDAHMFNPERWLNGTVNDKATSLGVYSNLMTFLAGARACIGWRFAVIEIQSFLTEIVEKFELALTEKPERIRRLACVLMAPTVEGEVKNGVHMTLRVSVAPRNEKGC